MGIYKVKIKPEKQIKTKGKVEEYRGRCGEGHREVPRAGVGGGGGRSPASVRKATLLAVRC